MKNLITILIMLVAAGCGKKEDVAVLADTEETWGIVLLVGLVLVIAFLPILFFHLKEWLGDTNSNSGKANGTKNLGNQLFFLISHGCPLWYRTNWN